MPIILMLLLLAPLVVSCFCSVFVDDGVFSLHLKLYLDDFPINFYGEKNTLSVISGANSETLV